MRQIRTTVGKIRRAVGKLHRLTPVATRFNGTTRGGRRGSKPKGCLIASSLAMSKYRAFACNSQPRRFCHAASLIVRSVRFNRAAALISAPATAPREGLEVQSGFRESSRVGGPGRERRSHFWDRTRLAKACLPKGSPWPPAPVTIQRSTAAVWSPARFAEAERRGIPAQRKRSRGDQCRRRTGRTAAGPRR
jgi:hypothetical protein